MRTKDVATFSTTRFTETVESMRARGEKLHDAGERVWRDTGTLDPLVDVRGGKVRASRNSMVRRPEGGCMLPNGIALPVATGFDGTGSMHHNIGHCFTALGALNGILRPLSNRYNVQMATSVVQDVYDPRPVVQFSQFETDTRIADQIRLLTPDKAGGDSTEDYDLLVAFLMLGVQADITTMYGLKGYGLIVGDEIGRDFVTRDNVRRHLGHELQADRMTTRDMLQTLLHQWHLFYVQVSSGHGSLINYTTEWWQRNLGANRVVRVTKPELLAETQAGLVYVTETVEPTLEGFVAFITAEGANKRITDSDARAVWGWITEARVPFGAQAVLPGYADIPLPGSIFAHYRHPWPIDHPLARENPELVDDGSDLSAVATVTSTPTSSRPTAIDWSKL